MMKEAPVGGDKKQQSRGHNWESLEKPIYINSHHNLLHCVAPNRLTWQTHLFVKPASINLKKPDHIDMFVFHPFVTISSIQNLNILTMKARISATKKKSL